jgi:dehydrogenase/reductase SDR family protein 4
VKLWYSSRSCLKNEVGLNMRKLRRASPICTILRLPLALRAARTSISPTTGSEAKAAKINPTFRLVPNTFDLKGKTALITGGTRGIGLAIARGLGASGATVVVSSRKEPAVTAVVAELRSHGIVAHGIPANVGRLDEALGAVDRAIDLVDGIDILVNNAATNPVYGPVAETSSEAFDKIMAVNVKAPFEIAKRVLPSMTARGGGVVLNISSVAGIAPETGLGIYSVSKAALISLTQVMAREWGRLNVRVNALCPGFIKTDFSAALWKNESIMTMLTAQQPIPRWGEPDEVADFAVFLCSDQARFCTGASYLVDGGFMVRVQFAAGRRAGLE